MREPYYCATLAHMALAWELDQITAALGISERALIHLKKRFVEEGLLAALERKKRERPPREVVFVGAFEARLLALACPNAPEGNAAFVAQMEEVLEIYHLPYGEGFPVVCFDESNKQLAGEIRTPIPCRPGAVRRGVLIMDNLNTRKIASLYEASLHLRHSA